MTSTLQRGEAAAFQILEDELGSSRIITTATGTVCYDADLYPFGAEQYVYTNTCPQNYKFTGKERDAETGLDEFGARYYSSALGRFTIPDWAAKPTAVPYAKFGDPQTLNLYSYVENSPVNAADADGHAQGDCTSCAAEGEEWIAQRSQALAEMVDKGAAEGAAMIRNASVAGAVAATATGTIIGVEVYAILKSQATIMQSPT